MKSSALAFGIAVITTCLISTACATPAGVTAPGGPWQFSGTVFALDGSAIGPPVGGAQLTLTSGGEVSAATTSDPAGHYAFSGLETGRFILTISAPGFVSLTPAVNLDRDMRADFAMNRQ